MASLVLIKKNPIFLSYQWKSQENVKKLNQHKICRPNREEYINYLRLQLLEQKKQLDINMIKIDKIFGCK